MMERDIALINDLLDRPAEDSCLEFKVNNTQNCVDTLFEGKIFWSVFCPLFSVTYSVGAIHESPVFTAPREGL